MAVKTYYVSKLGKKYKISEHFTLQEFQCSDGSDKVLVSDELLAKLEQLRAWLSGTVTIGINSGYRTTSYNKKIGGATNSNHTQGLAADIVVKQNGKRVSGKVICCIAAELGFKGVALIKGSGYSVHVDMSPNRIYRGDENYGYGNNVKNGDFYTYFKLSKATVQGYKAKAAEPAPKVETTPVKKEDETVTQEQFNKMMDAWIAAKKAEVCNHDWSKEARAWAEKDDYGKALVQGDGTSKAYHMYPTREELITILHRLVSRIG
jgi:uncharacterized protein YcbK (DUF882 family)